MHHHHWESLIHFPLMALWALMPWWLDKMEFGSHILTILAPYMAAIIGILQIAYLVRKHRRFDK